jgi:hypothetical protein
MGIPDPKPQFSYLVSQLRKHDLAYLHVIEPLVRGSLDVDAPLQGGSNDFLREIWCKEGKNGVFISAGGYTRQTAIETAQEHGGMIAFGRLYIPNVSPLCSQVHSLFRRVLTMFSSWVNRFIFTFYSPHSSNSLTYLPDLYMTCRLLSPPTVQYSTFLEIILEWDTLIFQQQMYQQSRSCEDQDGEGEHF